MVSTDVKKYRDLVLEQGKVALDEARKPLYAAVGAGDKLFEQVRGQLRELPAETQARLRKLQERGNTVNLSPTQVRQTAAQAAGQAKETYSVVRNQAVQTYETLAHDGELVVRRLRRRPEVRSAFDRVEDTLDAAGDAVADADDAVTKPAPKPRTRPAKKATAGKSTTSNRSTKS